MFELGREAKIGVVTVLTLGIFLLEIISGYLTGSIALIADSFHMLSDLLALLIAYYAIRLAKQRVRQPQFTFGYQRAEILGAFANAVFLLALCFTIIIEAIQRFADPVVIENPKMVLIVGCVGLGVNLLGMFLFGGHHGHDHGHSHGHGHGHSHKKKKVSSKSALPKSAPISTPIEDDSSSTSTESIPMETLSESAAVPMHYSAHARASIMAEANRLRRSTVNSLASHHGESHKHGDHHRGHSHSHDQENTQIDMHDDHNDDDHDHEDHSHGGHGGHDHGNMNMQGLFLHAMGDALGSLGVIITSLIIMFADGSWRYYMDPLVSLLISGLIISSAVPLLKSASFILLQGVPRSVSMDKLREEILALPGVLDVHELHVWGLSDNKNVASVHIRCYDSRSNSSETYMQVAANVKRLLHGYGVHSTTVQPEFVKPRPTPLNGGEGPSDKFVPLPDDENEEGCLLRCEGGACNEQVCCPSDIGELVVKGGTNPNGLWLVSKKSNNENGTGIPSPSESNWFKRTTPFRLGSKDSTRQQTQQMEQQHHGHSEASFSIDLHERSHDNSHDHGDSHGHSHGDSHDHSHEESNHSHPHEGSNK